MKPTRHVILAFAAIAAIAVAAIVAGMIAAGEGGSSGNKSLASNADELKSFTTFPVFWLGDSYGGLPLDRVIGPVPDGWEQPVLVAYGNCGTAFEGGCQDSVVVKTIPRCWPGLGMPSEGRIRERAFAHSPHLTLETGYGTVVVYADHAEEIAVAQALVVGNPDAFRDYAVVRTSDPLPGSLCEFLRLHPRVYPTPRTPVPFTPEARAATVISAFEAFDAGLVTTYTEAERKIGFRPLRNEDPRFTVAQEGAIGALRKLKNPLADFEQMYDMIGRGAPIQIRQEPESYPDFPRHETSNERIGDWDVQLYTDYGEAGAVFYSGASVLGQRIRVVMFAPRDDGYTLEDIRQFVSTLTTG